MRITRSTFSIPPYISTSWGSVSTLLVKDDVLFVYLLEGDSIEIPNLSEKTLLHIFKMHFDYLEMLSKEEEKEPFKFSNILMSSPSGLDSKPSPFLPFADFNLDPIKFLLDGMDDIIEHNPLLASAPKMPSDLLEKIGHSTKFIPQEEASLIPLPVENCMCLYCQMVRSMHTALGTKFEEKALEEEAVRDEELLFTEWKITPLSEGLYSVENPINSEENFEVSLKESLSCSCGKTGCSHLIAVLKS